VLRDSTDSQATEVADYEPGTTGERLELVALVRALEALPCPAHVTLVTASRALQRGLKVGLPAWRLNNWLWEHNDRWVPVRNRDLWQRVDRALQFHRLRCHLEENVRPAQRPQTDALTSRWADTQVSRWWDRLRKTMSMFRTLLPIGRAAVLRAG